MKRTHLITPDRIRVKRSFSGLGIFAHDTIRRGEYLEYTGELISHEEADRRGGKYLFEINSKVTVDGKGRDNLARYVNHSCKPNCESDTRGTHIYIVALRTIQPGEELTYDYGKEYVDEFIKPRGCKCPHCVRYVRRAPESASTRKTKKRDQQTLDMYRCGAWQDSRARQSDA